MFPLTYGTSGYVLKSDGAGALYWDNDTAGSSGGSGLWATSTDNDFVFQSDTGQSVILGTNATTSLMEMLGYQFGVRGVSVLDDVNQNI